jgi:hypothetical protein
MLIFRTLIKVLGKRNKEAIPVLPVIVEQFVLYSKEELNWKDTDSGYFFLSKKEN